MRNLTAIAPLLILLVLSINSPILATEGSVATTTDIESADPCEREVHALDREGLQEDADQAKSEAIAKLLRNSIDCLEALSEKTAFSGGNSGGSGQGSGSQGGGSQGGTQQGGSSNVNTTSTNNMQANQNPTTNSDPSQLAELANNAVPPPQPKRKESTLLKVAKNLNTAMKALSPTNVPFSSKEDVVIDSYSAQLYEAYELEQDPVLKQALADELAKYAQANK